MEKLAVITSSDPLAWQIPYQTNGRIIVKNTETTSRISSAPSEETYAHLLTQDLEPDLSGFEVDLP